jgi:uncharacterized small protein (DUF1192 family)
MLHLMDDDNLPMGLSGARRDAASLLVGEDLAPYSQDELLQRIALLEAEIARVAAHRAKADAHRRAAEAFFKPKAG